MKLNYQPNITRFKAGVIILIPYNKKGCLFVNKIVYCNKIPNLSESYTVVIDSKKVTTDTDF